MRIKLILKTIGPFFIFGLFAAQVYAADLVETYQLAMKNDATLTAARYSADAQSLNYDIERSLLFPQSRSDQTTLKNVHYRALLEPGLLQN